MNATPLEFGRRENLPSTCTVADRYFMTDTRQMVVCTSQDTWSYALGSGVEPSSYLGLMIALLSIWFFTRAMRKKATN